MARQTTTAIMYSYQIMNTCPELSRGGEVILAGNYNEIVEEILNHVRSCPTYTGRQKTSLVGRGEGDVFNIGALSLTVLPVSEPLLLR